MEKKLPVRLCIACRTQRLKRDLIRFVKNADGEISLDFTGKKPGRGAYIGDSKECIEKCIKQRMLNNYINKGYKKEMILNILDDISIDDLSNLKKDYLKQYNKLSKKYSDDELKFKLKNSLYQKGYKIDDINKVM